MCSDVTKFRFPMNNDLSRNALPRSVNEVGPSDQMTSSKTEWTSSSDDWGHQPHLLIYWPSVKWFNSLKPFPENVHIFPQRFFTMFGISSFEFLLLFVFSFHVRIC